MTEADVEKGADAMIATDILLQRDISRDDVKALARAALEASSHAAEGLRRERDEAQAMVQAWVHVAEGLEAHIMDREAMGDPASPSTYLSILRGDIADVKLRSDQICAARWAEYKRHTDRITTLEAENKRLREALAIAEQFLDRVLGECSGNSLILAARRYDVARAALTQESTNNGR